MLEKLGIKRGKMFIVWTDNTTTEHAIHKRKSGNRTVNDKWKLIQTLLVRLQANLVAQRVSSGENRANDLSRGIKADLKERNRVEITLPVDLRHLLRQT
jgi:hypothetical protein